MHTVRRKYWCIHQIFEKIFISWYCPFNEPKTTSYTSSSYHTGSLSYLYQMIPLLWSFLLNALRRRKSTYKHYTHRLVYYWYVDISRPQWYSRPSGHRPPFDSPAIRVRTALLSTLFVYIWNWFLLTIGQRAHDHPSAAGRGRFSLKGQCHEIFVSGFFHESVSLVLLIPVANLPLVSTTPVAICHRYQQHQQQICRWCQWHWW